MIKKIIYVVLSLVLTILVLGGIYVAGAVSKTVIVSKLVAGTKYDTISEDKYNSLLLKIYLKTVNLNKEYDIKDDIQCNYIISYEDGGSFCYGGGEYAIYQKTSIDDLADSKTKVVQFFDKDADGYSKTVEENKIVKIPSYLQKIINGI